MADICSIWSYHEIEESGYLSKRRARVLSIFTENPTRLFTATECVQMHGRGVSETTRNRITELEQMGFLEKVDTVECPLTKKTVNRWRWTGRKVPKIWREIKVICRHCEGTGHVYKKEWYDEEPDREKPVVPSPEPRYQNDLFDEE